MNNGDRRMMSSIENAISNVRLYRGTETLQNLTMQNSTALALALQVMQEWLTAGFWFAETLLLDACHQKER
jgi:hypothetical protein